MAPRIMRVVESLDQLQTEYGVKADYLRLRAYPFTRETYEFIAAHKRVYVIDQNRDGQMMELLKLDIAVADIAQAAQRAPLQRAAASTRAPSPTRSFRRRANKWRPRYAATRNAASRKRIASGSPCSTIAAARPRCAPVAATMRSPSASSTRFTRWASRPSASSRCRASAARRKPGLFHGTFAQLQFRSRTHAIGRDRRGAGEFQGGGDWRQRRRRHCVDRHWAVRSPDAAQSAHRSTSSKITACTA